MTKRISCVFLLISGLCLPALASNRPTSSKSGNTSTKASEARFASQPTVTASTAVQRGTLYDFGGDGRADISVFRPGNGTWYTIQSGDGAFTVFQFGADGDIPVAADYDGDGKTDAAVYRSGVWYRTLSSINSFDIIYLGVATDIPVPADFDGDGKADVAVFRPSNGTWYSLTSGNRGYLVRQFGETGDIPIPGDYDGDGISDITVFRPSGGTWFRINTSSNSMSVDQFGSNGDIPLAGDFDGDRKADLAVWRPSNGSWYVRGSAGGFSIAQLGVSTDVPVPADFDGDGKTDYSVFRPSNGEWYRLNSSDGRYENSYRWGVESDVPVEAPMLRGRQTPAPTPTPSPTPTPTPTPTSTPTPTPPPTVPLANCTWYVSTTGRSVYDGGRLLPWNLAYALSGAGGRVRPGNTVCILGGTYPGRFSPSLNGTASQPIIIRSYPGERVVIDGGLPIGTLTRDSGTAAPYSESNLTFTDVSSVPENAVIRIGTEQMMVQTVNQTTRVVNVVRGWNGTCGAGICSSWATGTSAKGFSNILSVTGSYTWYMGLEITNTGHITRLANLGEIDTGVGINDGCTAGCKFINNVIHNTGGGIGSFGTAAGSEYYGNLTFYNGWEAPGGTGDAGKGHGLYLQNFSTSAPVKRVAENLSFMNFGFSMQAYTDQGGINNLTFEGNAFFESSNPVSAGPTYNTVMGGGNQAFVGARLISNFSYNPTIAGSRRGTDAIGWAETPCVSPEIRDNYFASGDFSLSINCSNPVVSGNIFYTRFARAGSFPNNTYYSGRPTGVKIYARPNVYEAGRGNIIVYNWDRQTSVSVNLSALGLSVGQRFEIRDAQNYNGGPVVSGTYSGSPVSIPMTGTAVAPVYGTVSKQPTHSDREFGAFVVLPN